MADAPVTQLLQVLNRAVDFLRSHGVESPRLDAEVLLADVLGIDRIRLYVEYDRPLDRAELAKYRRAIASRASREPVAYITGRKEFMSLDFKVDRRVLIPRPDTEILVEAVRDEIVAAGIAAPRIVDIGTGSGAIACSLARMIPGARILGIDVSEKALEVASENVSMLGVGDQVMLAKGDLYEPLMSEPFSTDGWDHVDVIVSNPPYISSGELPTLQPEISRYEPREALDGGPDGLAFYRLIVGGANARLAPMGIIALEAGDGQAADICRLLDEAGFVGVDTITDYAGLERVVIGHASHPA